MKKIIALISVAILTSALQGCATAILGGAATGAAVVHDRRSAGTVIDDQSIELKAASAFSNDSTLKDHGNVSATSYNHVLLLTGQTASDQYRNRFAELAGHIQGVKRVVNEIQIGPEITLGQRSNDAYITSKAKFALTKVKLEGFDPTRVKVVTENGVVYLLGLVSQREANAAVDKIRYVRDVKQVVKVFEYL